jgi:hypothetical protein
LIKIKRRDFLRGVGFASLSPFLIPKVSYYIRNGKSLDPKYEYMLWCRMDMYLSDFKGQNLKQIEKLVDEKLSNARETILELVKMDMNNELKGMEEK